MLAQVPDLNDFVGGIRILLKPEGVVTIEFPHLMRLIEENQFDTIYHEHFSYFSFVTAEKIFEAHGMTVFDVEEIPTHGGSLRIYGCLRTRSIRITDACPRAEGEGDRGRYDGSGPTIGASRGRWRRRSGVFWNS